MSELDWGRRYLMCRPTYFGVIYEINPWMHQNVTVDRDLAMEQWETLVSNLRTAGATIDVMEGIDGWPDLVFTANAGIVNGPQFIPANFKYPERQGETAINMEYFKQSRAQIDLLPSTMVHEGAGDALPFGIGDDKVLVSGFGWRTEAAGHAYMSQMTGAATRSVELVDGRLYHVDLAFCPLDDRHAIVAEMAYNSFGAKTVQSFVPEPLVLTDEEALSFCCNSVVVGKNVIMPNCPPRVGRQLEQWGFNPIESRVDEFMKGGGGCRCLTLATDVTVGAYKPE